MFVVTMKDNSFRKFDYILIITDDYYWFFYTQNYNSWRNIFI
jgi:hypothetical protein